MDLSDYIRLDDPSLFGSETADTDQPDEVDKYFVSNPKFSSALDGSVPFSIARARKGVGKSALLKHVYHTAAKSGASVVLLTGADLADIYSTSDSSPNEILSRWTNVLCSAACSHISSQLDLPTNPAELAISRKFRSLAEGNSAKGWIGNLASRVNIKLPFVEMADLSAVSAAELLYEYQSKSNQRLWLLIDDIDATFQSSDKEKLILAQFFTAARLLSHRVTNFRIRASVRKDVWTTIARYDEALDKCEQHMVDIEWSNSGTLSILGNRIRNYLNVAARDNKILARRVESISDAQALNCVFESHFPWGSAVGQNHTVLHRLSGGRPRWALQLCKLAAAEALAQSKGLKKGQIKFGVVKHVLEKYSRYRIGDVVKEHRHQCERVEELIFAFDKSKAAFSTSEVLGLIGRRITKFYVVKIDENTSADKADIASFLFRIGFIEAVNIDDRTKNYRFEDYPHFFKALSADHSYVKWEINPSFRAALHV